jgi:hypothetical protein
MFARVPGALPQATVNVAFGQNFAPKMRNFNDAAAASASRNTTGRERRFAPLAAKCVRPRIGLPVNAAASG